MQLLENVQQIPINHELKEYQDMINPTEITATQITLFQNKFIATGGWDGTVTFYNREKDFELIQLYKNLRDKPIKCLLNMNNKYLAVCGYEKLLTILDPNNAEPHF